MIEELLKEEIDINNKTYTKENLSNLKIKNKSINNTKYDNSNLTKSELTNILLNNCFLIESIELFHKIHYEIFLKYNYLLL